MIQKIKTFVLAHKIIVGVAIIIIAVGAFFIFRKKAVGVTRYITGIVEKGNITTTVTGTGQVEAQNTIDLKPGATGDIVYVGVHAGQTVKRGTLIASTDSRDAKASLENAKISLAKLTKQPDTLTLLQKENSLTKYYNDGWNTVSSYINDMTLMISNLEDIYSSTGYLGSNHIAGITTTGKNKVSLGENSYYSAKKSIDDLNKLYKTLSRSSQLSDIDKLINKAYDSSTMMSLAIKNTNEAFNYVVSDLSYENDANTTTTRTDISSWLSSTNNYVNSLLSSINSIKEGSQSLSDTIAGTDELDIRSAQLTVQLKQDAVNDCYIYAPFDGVIATLTAKVGQSSGTSVGTLITKQKIATISLNEVDIAKVKLGQKATLTFDAIDALTISGEVAEIDSIGTVSQGVVTYTVKISFDTGDEFVKPGMSVSATIITDMKQDVLVVPSSATKTLNGISYVGTFASPLPAPETGVQGSLSEIQPTQVEVGIGLVDDTSTEITSGLKEGDIIVTKTITGTITTNKDTKTNKTSTPSIMGAVGGMGGGPRD